jgi:uncharacterized protein (DUF952 family)
MSLTGDRTVKMSFVYKILSRPAWAEACVRARFEGSAIDRKDGFIHLSSGTQAQETARLHFRDQVDLVVVAFEAERLGEALKWEPSRGGQLFPHFYGVIDPALAAWVSEAPLDEAGVPRLGPLP